MAAKYSSTILDEPIKNILDGIHESTFASLTKDVYGGDAIQIPIIEYFGGKLNRSPRLPLEDVDGLVTSYDETKNTYRLLLSPTATMPTDEPGWLSLLVLKPQLAPRSVSPPMSWFRASKFQTNPMKRIFSPARGLFVEIHHPNNPSKTRHRGQGAASPQQVR